jgi:hypothetical protein
MLSGGQGLSAELEAELHRLEQEFRRQLEEEWDDG